MKKVHIFQYTHVYTSFFHTATSGYIVDYNPAANHLTSQKTTSPPALPWDVPWDVPWDALDAPTLKPVRSSVFLAYPLVICYIAIIYGDYIW